MQGLVASGGDAGDLCLKGKQLTVRQRKVNNLGIAELWFLTASN